MLLFCCHISFSNLEISSNKVKEVPENLKEVFYEAPNVFLLFRVVICI